MLIKKLAEIDQVAYIRFASVYRKFRDIHDLVEQVKPLLEKGRTPAPAPKNVLSE